MTCSAVRTIDDHAQAFEIASDRGLDGSHPRTGLGVDDGHRAAGIGGHGRRFEFGQASLDSSLVGVRQLRAFGAEQLDAIVVPRVV